MSSAEPKTSGSFKTAARTPSDGWFLRASKGARTRESTSSPACWAASPSSVCVPSTLAHDCRSRATKVSSNSCNFALLATSPSWKSMSVQSRFMAQARSMAAGMRSSAPDACKPGTSAVFAESVEGAEAGARLLVGRCPAGCGRKLLGLIFLQPPRKLTPQRPELSSYKVSTPTWPLRCETFKSPWTSTRCPTFSNTASPAPSQWSGEAAILHQLLSAELCKSGKTRTEGLPTRSQGRGTCDACNRA
mmetsp:Transcript_119117/g.336961  ORF Transcript_119117/g.336961 Transcript_119117/m.336961 type:complete len:247 (+) Transcript_119117:1270-2010(+)